MSVALAPRLRWHAEVGNDVPACVVDDPATAENPVVLGTHLAGGALVLDVGNRTQPLLVCRTPRSAPDRILHLVLASLVRRPPTSIQVVLVDPGGTLVDHSGAPHVVGRAGTAAEVAEAISWAEAEVYRRCGWCADLTVRSYEALRQRLIADGRAAEVPARLVVVLTDPLAANRRQVERLAWMGRSAGIHLIVSIPGDEWVEPFTFRLLARDRSSIGLADLVELYFGDRHDPSVIAHLAPT